MAMDDVPPEQVFPTPVGVFPDLHIARSVLGRLPHARGGVSLQVDVRRQKKWSSPRPWGCF